MVLCREEQGLRFYNNLSQCMVSFLSEQIFILKGREQVKFKVR